MESQTRRTLKATEPDVPQHPHHQSGTYVALDGLLDAFGELSFVLGGVECADRGGH